MGILAPNFFRNTLALVFLAELLSFLGYFYQIVNAISFFTLAILTTWLSLRRVEYGIYVLLAELFIGSFGYIFYLPIGGATISIRLALWLIIMSVWLAKTIVNGIKNKKINVDFFDSVYAKYFLTLLTFVGWGAIRGFLNGNAVNNIFFDFNNWLYLLLIFPVFSAIKNEKFLKNTARIFFSCITYLAFKTFILAYVFSHNFGASAFDLYRWLRLSGLAEITRVQPGFSRIFGQSQIFILTGFFIIFFYFIGNLINKNNKSETPSAPAISPIIAIPILSLFLSSIITSFSRSFWLGLVIGLSFVFILMLFNFKIKTLSVFFSLSFASLTLSLLLILMAVKFPYPKPYASFNSAELFGQRATEIRNEAGASSRWQLLAPLLEKIKTAPLLGRGFGQTVTYKTNDPRILASNPSGQYTTYAFEWGWLDVWLKLGLFGMLAYLILFFKIIKDALTIGLKLDNATNLKIPFYFLGITVSLIVLIIVNVFSPYVNHPLGIGYLILTAGILDYYKNVRPLALF